MDYEKKYKEAIKRAKDMLSYKEVRREDMEYLFPELRESEDERIKRCISDAVRKYGVEFATGTVTKEKMLAWLEKQGEQKSNNESIDTCDSLTIKSKEFLASEKRDFGYFSESDNKVEPKFKVGDYIERKDGLGCHAKIIVVGVNVYGCEKLIHSEDESPFFDLMFKNQDEFQISSDFKQNPTDKVEPKFEVGQTIIYKGTENIVPTKMTISDIAKGQYWDDNCCIVPISDQDNWELVEQKPTDKVEPKFKVGDWVVRGDTIAQILDIQEQYYVGLDINGKDFTSSRFLSDDKIHLWTIQDAKDGDVLCYKDEISLYKHDIKNCTKQETTFGGFVYHCCYDGRRFITDSLYSLTEQDKMDIHPATKEQRDLLFQKMNESGYVWDAEKKELKKIEPIDEYEGLTDFERAVADICIGWIGKEIGWKQYIKDNADVLLKIAVEKFNSVQDVPFEQKPTDEEMKELLRTEYEKIRESLLEYLHTLPNHYTHGGVCVLEWIAWLEKQGQVKESTISQHEEDESIRKGIIRNLEYLMDRAEGFVKDELKERIAWLEKQGEQKLPIEKLSSEMKTIGESLGFTTQEECNRYNQMVTDLIMSDDGKGEQKPFDYENANIQQKDFAPKVKPKFKVGQTIIYKGTENIVPTKMTISDIVKGQYWDDNCCIVPISDQDNWELVEQKPTDEEMKEALKTEYEKGRADAIAEMQKLAWSEEDIRNMEDIDSALFYDKDLPEDTCMRLRNWLKSLKDRVLPQPKQEWSEEDEHRIKDTVYFLDTAKKHYASTEELDACIDWVKSLKPQNMCVYNPYKAVVESIAEMCKHYDKASHSGLRDFYDNVKVKCKDAKEYDSLYPQNCWKPSDVQMKALDDALSLAKNCGEENAFDLRTLYEQLKKLNEE